MPVIGRTARTRRFSRSLMRPRNRAGQSGLPAKKSEERGILMPHRAPQAPPYESAQEAAKDSPTFDGMVNAHAVCDRRNVVAFVENE